MAEKELSEIFKEAAEIAKLVPENMQEAAFNRALDILTMSSNQKSVRPKPSSSTRAKPGAPASDNDVDNLINTINSTDYPEVKAADKVIDRTLLILKLALQDHGIDGLSVADISKILKEKFRINSTGNAINMALSRASELVDRIPSGNTHLYRIMAPGEAYLEKRENGETPNSVRSKRKSRVKKRSPKEPSSAAQKKKPDAKKSKVGLGAVSMLKRAIEEGLLAKPQTIGDICVHCADNYARHIKPNEISGTLARMVRDQELSRKKNADGQYEYTAS